MAKTLHIFHVDQAAKQGVRLLANHVEFATLDVQMDAIAMKAMPGIRMINA